jgi:hypothetical protein
VNAWVTEQTDECMSALCRCHTPGRPTGAPGPQAHSAAALLEGGGRLDAASSEALQQPTKQWLDCVSEGAKWVYGLGL